MDSVTVLVLCALLAAFVGDVAASCRKMANEDMLEYYCEGGYPADLTTVPETTEKLRIDRMPLRQITVDTFSRFGENLWVLSCSHCEITDIDEDAFRRLTNLQQLNLENNHLTTVRALWFEGLDYLTYLDLSYNDIHDIEDGVYKNLPSLVDFRISGNRLRCLNLDAMSHLRELKRMFLSENSEFACPHAVSKFLENQGVIFEQDPEWRRLASDTIEVNVPPSYAEEDIRTTPAYRERLHTDRRPPPMEPEVPHVPQYGQDSRLYPNYNYAEHHSRHRKPTTPTQPTMKHQSGQPLSPENPRISHVPAESSPQQVVFYSPERPQASSAELGPSEDIRMRGTDGPSQTEHTLIYPPYIPPLVASESSEDIRMIETDRLPQTERILTYPPYVSTHETVPYPSYPTLESSRTSLVASGSLSENTRTTETDRSLQTERILTYPSYVPIHQTIPYPSHPTERSRISATGMGSSSENERVAESNRPSQAENTVTYPLYAETSDGREIRPHGSIQMTYPSSSDSGTVNFNWSTDASIEHPSNSVWMEDRERHEQSRRPIEGNDMSSWSTNTPDHRETPYHMGQDARKAVIDNWSSNNGVIIATDRSVGHDKADHSKTTMSSETHYVRPLPSQPELMNSPATDEFYQAPYYETTATMHTPLQDYQERDQAMTVRALATTDKPLPDCPNRNSGSWTQPTAILVMSVIITIYRYVIVEGF